MSYFVTHLECSDTGKTYEAGKIHNLSDAGKPLLVRYNLEGVRNAFTKDMLAERPWDMWRYRELLPYKDPTNVVSLGETVTPVIRTDKLAKDAGGKPDTLFVKDEGRLPTSSFKARGLAMAVTMAKEFGIKKIAMPTNGNAGAALAAYCSRADMESYIFCPTETPEINVREAALHGGHIYRYNGQINECGKIVGEGKEITGWFDCSTLKEPYRVEGKKTMGLELAEQMNWDLPDVIFYPTGGGTGLIAMWKVFAELVEIGWLKPEQLPRMVAVQADGCAPIVKAYEEGKDVSTLWENPKTMCIGTRVPIAVADFLILRTVRESNGFAIGVSDAVIEEARADCGAREGLLLCPEGAATLAAYRKALSEGRIRSDDRAVLFNCGNGLKYPMPEAGPLIEKPIDYSQFK